MECIKHFLSSFYFVSYICFVYALCCAEKFRHIYEFSDCVITDLLLLIHLSFVSLPVLHHFFFSFFFFDLLLPLFLDYNFVANIHIRYIYVYVERDSEDIESRKWLNMRFVGEFHKSTCTLHIILLWSSGE